MKTSFSLRESISLQVAIAVAMELRDGRIPLVEAQEECRKIRFVGGLEVSIGLLDSAQLDEEPNLDHFMVSSVRILDRTVADTRKRFLTWGPKELIKLSTKPLWKGIHLITQEEVDRLEALIPSRS